MEQNLYIAQSDEFDGYSDMTSDSVLGYEVEYLNAEELDFLDLANYIREYLPNQ